MTHSMMQHYLLTRFNVNVYQGTREDSKSFDTAFGRKMPMSPDAWMEHRLDLFRRFCLPSIAQQTNADFTWLLFIDIETPFAYYKELEALLDEVGYIRSEIVEVDNRIDAGTVGRQAAIDYINSELKPETKWVITTRMDNDDMLDKQFIELVQKQANRANKPIVINPAKGYHFVPPNQLGAWNHPTGSPFISFVEPAHGKLRTVFAVQHVHAIKLAQVVPSIGQMQWAHVEHKRNAAGQRGLRNTRLFDAVMLAERFGYRVEAI